MNILNWRGSLGLNMLDVLKGILLEDGSHLLLLPGDICMSSFPQKL